MHFRPRAAAPRGRQGRPAAARARRRVWRCERGPSDDAPLLAEEPLGTQEQHEDEDDEPEGVAVAVGDVDGAEALQHTEREPAADAPWHRPHATDHADNLGLP